MSIPKRKDLISLALGLPHPSCFPLKGINLEIESPESDFKETEKISRDIESNTNEIIQSCQYMSSNGLLNFNNWVKTYIEKYFKPNYNENNWNYLIQSGGTQSLDSIFRMLIDPTLDSIICENLTYSCFLETCIPFRVNLLSVGLDNEGISVNDIDNLLNNWSINYPNKRKPKFIYTVPTGQNPTGITMSLKRRKDLLNICNKHDLLIIEDDPYYHLQLNDEQIHIPSLLKFDTEGRVIRIDSFSKMLMPGLRVSIVTANKLFIKKLSMHNELSIHSASANSQLILSMIFQKWGDDGFQKWISHLQKLYKLRRDLMLKSFDKYLPKDLVNYNRPNYGMFIWINANLEKFYNLKKNELNDNQWATFIEDKIFDVASQKYDVILTKGHWFMKDKENTNISGFRATYSFANEDEIVKGSELFGKAVTDVYNSLYN